MRNPIHRFLWLVLSFQVGCSTFTVKPEFPKLLQPVPLVHGQIDYDGNHVYIPRTTEATADGNSSIVLRYQTTEQQDDSAWDIIAMFNPLTIIGFPAGQRSSTLTGKLEIVQAGTIMRSYTATCLAEAMRGIYYGASFSELRRMGLLAIRDNIEAQMARDGPFVLAIPHDTRKN